jgi:diguanylate cyclase (GGDEF)-like protein
MPLHHQRCVFGYFVITDSLALFRDGFIYYVSNRLNQYLERFRKDKKLEILNRQLGELYTHDPLTGLYNRFGHEKTSVPLVEKNRAEGKNSIVVFADINRMKYINDQFGHLQGDLALRAVADSLRQAAPADWIISRFGGDEFILVGSCAGRDEAEERIQALRDQIDAKEKRMSLPYRLRASFGYFLVSPESHDPLSRYLSLADEAMYADKKESYEKDGLGERPSRK